MGFRDTLRRWMLENSRGPAWVAKQTGYTREWISSVLNGRKPMSERLARSLAESLGLESGVSAAQAATESPEGGETNDLVINPEPRCPCVIILDAALGADKGLRAGLLGGLQAFQRELGRDRLTARRVEIAAVLAGDTSRLLTGFLPGDDFLLTASDLRPGAPARSRGLELSPAVAAALKLLDDRRAEYQKGWIDWYRPWALAILRRPPRDAGAALQRTIRELESRERARFLSFFAVGVDGADAKWAEGTALRRPLRMAQRRFPELFTWLAESLRRVTSSVPGDRIPLPEVGPFTRR
ncbi:MAG: helix-turn-helix domain-containing protein [Planctomycetes bacterium]|nr:helix-turn-helix domain-containing protein [Planctomycetota bacterium]